jgi:hypothetical protein
MITGPPFGIIWRACPDRPDESGQTAGFHLGLSPPTPPSVKAVVYTFFLEPLGIVLGGLR